MGEYYEEPVISATEGETDPAELRTAPRCGRRASQLRAEAADQVKLEALATLNDFTS